MQIDSVLEQPAGAVLQGGTTRVEQQLDFFPARMHNKGHLIYFYPCFEKRKCLAHFVGFLVNEEIVPYKSPKKQMTSEPSFEEKKNSYHFQAIDSAGACWINEELLYPFLERVWPV